MKSCRNLMPAKLTTTANDENACKIFNDSITQQVSYGRKNSSADDGRTSLECTVEKKPELLVINLVIIINIISEDRFRLRDLFHHHHRHYVIQIMVIINHTWSSTPRTTPSPSPSPPHHPDASALPQALPTNPAAANVAGAPCASDARNRHPRTLP